MIKCTLGICDCLHDHPCVFRSKLQWWGFWQQWRRLFLAGSLKESSRWVTLCCSAPAVWPRPSSPPCCKVCLSGVLLPSCKRTKLTNFKFKWLSFKDTVNSCSFSGVQEERQRENSRLCGQEILGFVLFLFFTPIWFLSTSQLFRIIQQLPSW